MKTTHKLFAMTIACALLAPAALLAQFSPHVPTTMFYEGYLEEGGSPVNGQRDFSFEIFDAASVGSSLYDDTITNVTVTEGWFTVELGRGADLWPLALEEASWLEVSVGATTLPREPLHSVPYALRAGAVEWDNVIGVPDDQVFGNITADNLTATATVTAVDLVATDLTLTNPPTITSPTVKTMTWWVGPNALVTYANTGSEPGVPCFQLINGRGGCVTAGGGVSYTGINIFLDGVPDGANIQEWGLQGGTRTSYEPDDWECGLKHNNATVGFISFTETAHLGTNFERNEVQSGLDIDVDNSESIADPYHGWVVKCANAAADTEMGLLYLKQVWIKYTEG